MEITIPGALADFLADTNLATGDDDHDPASKATRLALHHSRSGRGRTQIIVPTLAILDVISEYAETLLTADECSRSERDAARLWMKRAEAARPSLAAEQHAVEGCAPRDLAHPDVADARTALDGLRTATLADRHVISEPTAAEQATDRTWRGGWIAGTPAPADEVLFDLGPADTEQGALFN
ncbi:hypothetical protein ACGH2B_12425 [Streptomyces sp. BBFR2]|uniref:hypothetical protein n=1 Tax=Streptomyces sp. BBFR2 TaxID=3372854 RepID=UPI0037DA3A71